MWIIFFSSFLSFFFLLSHADVPSQRPIFCADSSSAAGDATLQDGLDPDGRSAALLLPCCHWRCQVHRTGWRSVLAGTSLCRVTKATTSLVIDLSRDRLAQHRPRGMNATVSKQAEGVFALTAVSFLQGFVERALQRGRRRSRVHPSSSSSTSTQRTAQRQNWASVSPRKYWDHQACGDPQSGVSISRMFLKTVRQLAVIVYITLKRDRVTVNAFVFYYKEGGCFWSAECF